MLAEFYELEEQRDSLVWRVEALECELETTCEEAFYERDKVELAKTLLMLSRRPPVAFRLYFLIDSAMHVPRFLRQHSMHPCKVPCLFCAHQRRLVHLVVEAVNMGKNA